MTSEKYKKTYMADGQWSWAIGNSKRLFNDYSITTQFVKNPYISDIRFQDYSSFCVVCLNSMYVLLGKKKFMFADGFKDLYVEIAMSRCKEELEIWKDLNNV